MKICLIGPAWPYRGGISHYNTCLAAELAGRHEVEVINYTRLYPEFIFPGKTQYDESGSSLKTASTRMIDSINPFTWVRAGFHTAAAKPDAVIVQWWHPYFAPALFKISSILRMMRRGKVIFICHNVVPHERSAVDRMLTRIAFSAAHGFLVQSSEDRENLLGMKRNARVMMHPHPIYDFFKKGELRRDEARRAVGEGDGPLLLFFGYIRPYKGLRHLLRAMPAIRKKIGARLLVVGEFYEERKPYDALISDLGIADHVRVIDRYVGNEEVAGYFSASDLVVLPYDSATQSGIAQISIAFDRPMVVTRVGGLPEVVSEGKTGFTVPPSNPEAIAEAVVRFFTGGWAERMAPHFEEEKRRFSWSAMVDELESFIEGLHR